MYLCYSYGYACQGNEVLYSGITGAQLHTSIFMGPIYYQLKLRLWLQDENAFSINWSGSSIDGRTQPAAGRANNGGLLIGKWNVIVFISRCVFIFTRNQ